MAGPVLPATLAPLRSSHWVVGAAAEWFGSGADLRKNQILLGLDVMLRAGAFGPHAVVMMEPSPLLAARPEIGGYEQYRVLAGLGLRGYFPWLGTEFSYGSGAHLEIRLEDHYWLSYLSPLELGVKVYRRPAWDIQLFMGARCAFSGSLIDHFLIDPNGFDNENARDELNEVLHQDRWRAFLSVVYGRRLD